jgi:hypothetical protein
MAQSPAGAKEREMRKFLSPLTVIACVYLTNPRLTPWAIIFRRYAAEKFRPSLDTSAFPLHFYPQKDLD